MKILEVNRSATPSITVAGHGWSVKILGGRIIESIGFASPSEIKGVWKKYHAIISQITQ